MTGKGRLPKGMLPEAAVKQKQTTTRKHYENYICADAAVPDNFRIARRFQYGGTIAAARTAAAGATNETRAGPGPNGTNPARQKPAANL